MARLAGLVIAFAVLLMAGPLLWGAAAAGDPGGPRRQWLYDPATRELFPGPMLAQAPIAAPSDQPGQRSGVLAVVVRQPAGGTAIAYLISHQRPGSAAPVPSAASEEVWYSLPGTVAWISSRDPRAAAITARARELAGDGPPILDFPADR